MSCTVNREHSAVDARCVCSAAREPFSDLNAGRHACTASLRLTPEQVHAASEITGREIHEFIFAERKGGCA